MIIRSVDLVISAASPSQFPPSNFPEIAFVGRSNVGKSSLINALLNRKRVAYVSGRPGKTQTINFFDINHAFHLVDLPGYGYAAVAKTKKASWGKLMEDYVKSRPQLSLVLHLVDSRHEPSQLDIEMAAKLRASHRRVLTVGTKRDKLGKSVVGKHALMLQQSLELEEAPLLFTINDGKARVDLWQRIVSIVPSLNPDSTMQNVDAPALEQESKAE